MDAWIVYLILAAIPGVIVFAAIYKYMEVMQASRWPSTPGRIVASSTQSRDVSRGDANSSDVEVRTFAKVEYEYVIAGQKYRGDRISIGEDLGNFEVAETIARYPVGQAVTVYYNPSKRTQAVLERDLPPGVFKVVVILVLGILGLYAGIYFGFGALAAMLSGKVSNAPFVAAILGFTALASLIIYAIQKQASQQRAWPTVKGRVESSGVHAFASHDDGRTRTHYRADVIYSYEVAGVSYTGDKLSTGQSSSNIEAGARRNAARYPEGSSIQVHYNPKNPAEAIINPGGWALLLLWLVPIGLLMVTYFAATQ